MKQPCMEEFLGIKDRIYDNGKECIKLYKDFLKKRDAFTADEILGHNLEDVLGLGRIFDMLGYLCIYDGDYEVTYSEFDGDNLILKLKLPCTLPQEFSNGNTDFYLTGKDEEINLIIKTTDGKLKQYYADYKDYYYLPEEDTVIPKSLGSGIDRKHRKAAPEIPVTPGLPAPMPSSVLPYSRAISDIYAFLSDWNSRACLKNHL